MPFYRKIGFSIGAESKKPDINLRLGHLTPPIGKWQVKASLQ
ncbi:hypothetical protein [Methanothermobacter tenebrarum]|nr:hypothetical protein [Methanothermobacter tenebrarum]